ncbi:MAG TPA: hypothetical protein VNW54_09400 [Granulicella sp.]|jgi:hypothetical protein|nr:hypothetical protein [Granulicella sp.]
MSSSRKKVIVRRFTGDTLPGYLPLSSIVRGHSVVDLLDLTGRILPLALADIKTVSYVREFNLTDGVNPERLFRRTFLARPRTEGLWLRLTFRTGEVLEGLAPTDLSLLDSIQNDAGLHLIPPDTRTNTQRIFVPRSAVTELQLLAVITSPSRRKALVEPTEEEVRKAIQEELFKNSPATSDRPN